MSDDWEDDFDYDEYIAEHHSDQVLSKSMRPIWRWTAIVLLALIAIAGISSVWTRS